MRPECPKCHAARLQKRRESRWNFRGEARDGEYLRILPAKEKPPVPVRRPGKRWSNLDLHPFVWHCALRYVVKAGAKLQATVVADLMVIVRFADGEEIEDCMRATFTRTLGKGYTPKALTAYGLKRLAWYLATALGFGWNETGIRVPIKGLWVLHEPSNTKTWLPATPYHKYRVPRKES